MGSEVAVRAGVAASDELNVKIAFAGIPGDIYNCIEKLDKNPHSFRLVPASQKIDMGDDPVKSLKNKPDATILKATTDVAQGNSDAVVSPGHTGATVVAAREILKMCSTIRRPALCQRMPAYSDKSFFMLDVGACLSVSPRDFAQFALLGHVAAQSLLGIESPRIGLLNIGN